MTPLAEILNRTLLLMRDEFGPDIDDRVLLRALTSTRVALIADAANITSHAAQTTFVTAAMLMARSGHQVFLMAPGEPEGEVDLAIGLGGTSFNVRARRRIRLNAEAWAGIIMREDRPRPWQAALWPLGALAAAGLGAGEAFKIAMLKLLPHALSPETSPLALPQPTK